MAASSVLKFQDVVSLPRFNISPQAFKFDALTLQSDRTLCARDTGKEPQEVCILDPRNESQLRRFPVRSGDAVMMHPNKPVVSVRAGNVIQLINVERQEVLGSINVAETVRFWTWINDITLALITDSSVMHWNVTQPAPAVVFARNPEMANLRITSYSATSDGAWCVLVGVGAADNQIVGSAQLWSVERQKDQILPALAACFCEITAPGGVSTNVLAFVSRDGAGYKIHMIETKTQATGYSPKNFPISFVGAQAASDFPLFMAFNKRFEFCVLFSKFGNVAVYDVPAGIEIAAPMPGRPVFVVTTNITAPDTPMLAPIAMAVTPNGDVVSFDADVKTLVPYVMRTLGKQDAAFSLACRAKLGGGEELFRAQFERMFQAHQYMEAAQLVLQSGPNLRTETTMQRFLHEAPIPGQPPAIFQYFSALSAPDGASLNEYETLTLASIVLRQGKLDVLQKFFEQSKLTPTVKLGDIVKNSGIAGADTLSLVIYNQIKAHDRVMIWMVEHGQADKIVPYLQRLAADNGGSGAGIDFMGILRSLVDVNPEGAAKFALILVNPPAELQGIVPQVDPEAIVRIFVEHQYVREAAAVLLELCRLHDFNETTGPYQTRLLELSLRSPQPEVAEKMFAMNILHYYDVDKIAHLCEQAGLYERALSMYTNIDDVKRCVVHSERISVDFFVEWSSQLTPEDALIIYRTMLAASQSQATITLVGQSVIRAQKDRINPSEVMNLLLEFGKKRSDNRIDEAMYFYLGAIVNGSDDPEVHFQYIVSATRMHNTSEVERMCRESEYLEPVKEKLRDFLMDAPEYKTDQRQIPLGLVCARFEFVGDLIKYLFKSSKFDAIEYFAVHIAPNVTGTVVGMLLDMDCDAQFIAKLCMAVRSLCDVDELVGKLEARNRVRILKNMIRARIQEGVTDSATYTAWGKVLVECELKGDTADLDTTASRFVQENDRYDHKALGSYCEKRDPTLAFLCYATDKSGESNLNLIRVSNQNSLQKQLSRFLVQKKDSELWALALSEEGNPEESDRKSLADQTIATAVPEACSRGSEDEVTVTIKAFRTAGLGARLIELLEKIVLDRGAGDANNVFAQNPTLQTLLLVTAIENDPHRVAGYIKQLDNYDAEFAASRAIDAELYEEAFEMYHRAKLYVQALNTLLVYVGFARADEYAQRVTGGEGEESLVDESMGKKIWSCLGRAQLGKAESALNGILSAADEEGVGDEDPAAFFARAAIHSFSRAEDPAEAARLIEVASQLSLYNEIVPFLRMAREQVKDSNVDTGLCSALARAGRLAELEEFVEKPNLARVQQLADLLFEEATPELTRACVVLYTSISNWACLTSCHLFLGDFKSALSSAKKANSAHTWQQVMMRAVEAGEFVTAAYAGNQLVLDSPDELDVVIEFYEQRGHIRQLLDLLETAIRSDRAQKPLFTALGRLKCRYEPERLMAYLEAHIDQLNTAQLIQATKHAHMWRELVVLYRHDEEYDNAADVMIQYPVAWAHSEFKTVLTECVSLDLMYRAARHYLECRPHLLNDLLLHLCSVAAERSRSVADGVDESKTAARIDPARIVSMVEPMGQLPLIAEFLLALPSDLCNTPAVNGAIHKLLIARLDHEELLARTRRHPNFDQLELARQLENHPLVQMRRVAVELYRANKRYSQALALSKQDLLFGDCMATAAMSGRFELCEDLLRWFVEGDLSGRRREGVDLRIDDERELRAECFAACLFRCYRLLRADVVLEVAYLHGMTSFAVPFFVQTMRRCDDRISALEARAARAEEEAQQHAQQQQQQQQQLAQAPPPGAAPDALGGVPDAFAAQTFAQADPFMQPADPFAAAAAMGQPQDPWGSMTPGF